MSIKVLVADDHPLFRAGVTCIIDKEKDMELIGEAVDGQDAVEKIFSLNPDIAVLDISMPKLTGLAVARKINESGNNRVKIIILSMHNDAVILNEAINAKVGGYILKDNAVTELVKAIEVVHSGKRYISASLSDALLNIQLGKEALEETTPALSKLTKSEKKILQLIASNKTSKEIAEEGCLSIKTVLNHRANICKKLGLKGHSSLLLFAIKNSSCI